MAGNTDPFHKYNNGGRSGVDPSLVPEGEYPLRGQFDTEPDVLAAIYLSNDGTSAKALGSEVVSAEIMGVVDRPPSL
jgi:hypothetical protein